MEADHDGPPFSKEIITVGEGTLPGDDWFVCVDYIIHKSDGSVVDSTEDFAPDGRRFSLHKKNDLPTGKFISSFLLF